MTMREPGWYRDELGRLRYWSGKSWAGRSDAGQSQAQPPARAWRPPVTPPPRWRFATTALGWIAAIFFLGMLLTGVSTGHVDCGMVLDPHETSADCAAALDYRTTQLGVTGAAALVCLAAGSRAAARVSGSRCLRGTPVVV